MPNWSWQTLHFLQVAALGLWLGGTITLGALVAPVVFRLAGTRAEAGRIMAAVFERFDRIVLGCVVCLVATSVAFVGLYGRFSAWYAVQYVCLAMMCASGVFGALVLSPRVRRLRLEGRATESEFRRLHRLSVLTMQFNLACGTVALWLT